MRSDKPLRLAWAIILTAAATVSVLAQPEASDPCRAKFHSPGDLSLTIALKGDQAVFQRGEIIPIIETYSASSHLKYIWNSKSYDRSGRADGLETFCLQPAVGQDPLDEYFAAQQFLSGGGLFSMLRLGPEKQTIEIELNEWLELPPGNYTLRLIGYRAITGREEATADWNKPAIPARSNQINFSIVDAEPDWQASQLAAAIRTLDSPAASREAKMHAQRIIRFLGTDAALQEAVRRFAATPNDAATWEYDAAIWGAAQPERSIDLIKAELERNQGSSNKYLVWTLAELEIQSDPAQKQMRIESQSKDGASELDREANELNRRVQHYRERYGLPE